MLGLLWGCFLNAQLTTNDVQVIGAMKNVMWKGQLEGIINLDTFSQRTHLYGLGPVEFLSGEILILDGQSYKSSVINDTTMRVEETFTIKAPFFGYANISKWEEWKLPSHILTIPHLELYLDSLTKTAQRPFLFKLTGIVEQATIHIVNLPEGASVSSPDEAHQGLKKYQLQNEESVIVGFFSTAHQTIFTHHDTFVHMHLITHDRLKMGHLDEVLFKKGTIRLFLPAS